MIDKAAEREKAVRDRRRQEKQARCPHEHTVSIATHDRPHDRLCQDCGATLTREDQ